MTEKQLSDFLKEHEVKIGVDFEMSPPHYYTSLYEAFYHYFLTFRDIKDSIYFHLTNGSWTRKELISQATGYNENIAFSILGFHRFFELFLKGILAELGPFYAVKFPQKEKDIYAYIDNQLDATELPTIEFADTLKRFKVAYNYFAAKDEYDTILKPYEFITSQNNIATIEIVASWRNRIMHNGTSLLTVFAYDYIVSQKILPLIREIAQQQSTIRNFPMPYYFETKSGINVISEIEEIKFDFNDFDEDGERPSLAYKLLKLGHLKEIGRVSINNNWAIRLNHSYFEHHYENPIGRCERFAASEATAKDFYRITECPCCQSNSLVIYRSIFDDVLFKVQRLFSWFKCYNCDYSIGNENGDPFEFGIGTEHFFPKK